MSRVHTNLCRAVLLRQRARRGQLKVVLPYYSHLFSLFFLPGAVRGGGAWWAAGHVFLGLERGHYRRYLESNDRTIYTSCLWLCGGLDGGGRSDWSFFLDILNAVGYHRCLLTQCHAMPCRMPVPLLPSSLRVSKTHRILYRIIHRLRNSA